MPTLHSKPQPRRVRRRIRAYTYIKGGENILADTFSRLPRLDQEDGKVELTDAYFAEADEFHDLLEDDDLFECFLSLPVMASPGNNPLNYKFIRDQQQACQALATARQRHPHDYNVKELNDNVHIICHVKPGTDPNVNWKIALPNSMLNEAISWFHTVPCHPGQKRLNEAMQTRYYHPDMRRMINNLRCEVCSKNKLSGPGYGLLPEREVRGQPFEEIAVNLIGPWTVRVNGRNYTFYALTIIDTVRNLVELIRLDNCEAEHTRMKLIHAWFARYPWPQRVVHDPGSQFIAEVFDDPAIRAHEDQPNSWRSAHVDR